VGPSALCLPLVALQGGEGLHVVGDVGSGASETLAVEGEGVLETGRSAVCPKRQVAALNDSSLTAIYHTRWQTAN
jgi:hypothetical protein